MAEAAELAEDRDAKRSRVKVLFNLFSQFCQSMDTAFLISQQEGEVGGLLGHPVPPDLVH